MINGDGLPHSFIYQLSFIMLLALIGYRGSGKTAVAQAVALRLGWDWVDADVEIELRAGKSIAAIFADDGEQSFRDLEHTVLAELIHRRRTVLAFGGGVVLRAGNRRLLRSACEPGGGKVVWLKASPETLWRRIQADPATAQRRPNLTVAGGLDEIGQLLGQREALYRECADYEIDTDGKLLAEVASEIVAWMSASQATRLKDK
jgi:shikimate kinase